MPYGNKDNIRAYTGLTVSEITDATLDTIITAMDSQVDQFPGVSLSSTQKALVSDYFCSAIAVENVNGTMATSNLTEIIGGIKLDTKTAALIRTNQAKGFWNKAQEILAGAPSTDLVVKVE